MAVLDLLKNRVLEQETWVNVKNDTLYSKEKFASLEGLSSKLLDKSLQELLKENVFITCEHFDDVNKGKAILQSASGKYYVSDVMGVLFYGNKGMIIGSCFGKDEQDYYLQTMLEKMLSTPYMLQLDFEQDFEKSIYKLLAMLCVWHLKRDFSDDVFISSVAKDKNLLGLLGHTVEFIGKDDGLRVLLFNIKDEVSRIEELAGEDTTCDKQSVVDVNRRSAAKGVLCSEDNILRRLCMLLLTYRSHHLGFASSTLHGILFAGAWGKEFI